MSQFEELEKAIQLCAKIKSQIEKDCEVTENELDGEMFLEYVNKREEQKQKINKIYWALHNLK